MKGKVFFKWIQWVLKKIRHSNEIFMQLIFTTKWNCWEKKQAKVNHLMLNEKNLSNYFWAKVMVTFVYIMNKTIIIAIHYMIFENKFINKKLDISQLKIFGWLTYVHVPNDNKTKLDF